MVIDRCNRVSDHRKALLNGHHDRQYLDVTTTLTNFNFLHFFPVQSLPYFKIADQIFDGNITPAIRNMEIVSNNLTF